MSYLWNCGWLVIPLLILNLLLVNRLPASYRLDARSLALPGWLRWTENILRPLVFGLPFLMPIHVETTGQKAGLALYGVGVCLYAISWAAQILFPGSRWSRSASGFLAPAYTPLLWLFGIALVGQRLYLPVPYSPWIYAGLCAAFLCLHNLHIWAAYRLTRETLI